MKIKCLSYSQLSYSYSFPISHSCSLQRQHHFGFPVCYVGSYESLCTCCRCLGMYKTTLIIYRTGKILQTIVRNLWVF